MANGTDNLPDDRVRCPVVVGPLRVADHGELRLRTVILGVDRLVHAVVALRVVVVERLIRLLVLVVQVLHVEAVVRVAFRVLDVVPQLAVGQQHQLVGTVRVVVDGPQLERPTVRHADDELEVAHLYIVLAVVAGEDGVPDG